MQHVDVTTRTYECYAGVVKEHVNAVKFYVHLFVEKNFHSIDIMPVGVYANLHRQRERERGRLEGFCSSKRKEGWETDKTDIS